MSRAALWLLGAGLVAAAIAAGSSPANAGRALGQTWPAFVLVSGLLLVGVAAAEDGLFEAAGSLLARIPGGGGALFFGAMALVAAVTATLNLDTSVVFLTPVLLHASRRREVDETPFLYGAVFMSNAASLLLPGSNLTNLIVLARDHVAGATFAGRMAPAWVASCCFTSSLLWVVHRRSLRRGQSRRPVGNAQPERAAAPGVLGTVATFLAAAAVVALPDPALPVLAIGLVAAALTFSRGRLEQVDVVRAVNPATLAGLLGVAVALGTLARVWSGPSRLVASAGTWATAGVAAASSAVFNNLPAAVLLGSRVPAHPRALLIGLDVGPNLAVTGALSAILWLQVGKASGGHPSAARYSRLGVVLAPAAMLGALAATAWLAPGHL